MKMGLEALFLQKKIVNFFITISTLYDSNISLSYSIIWNPSEFKPKYIYFFSSMIVNIIILPFI